MEQPEQLDYHIYKEYQILEKVGKGTYGIVYKARHKKSNRVIAIKKIIDAFQNLIDAKRTYRELNYLLQMDHPCIVRLEYLLHLNRKGMFNQPSTSRLAVPLFSIEERGSTTDKLFCKPPQQAKHVYAVFEFIETDLSCALRKCTEMQPIQRKYIAYQLLQGIAYLHRSGLVHRDVKPSNILLNCNNLQVKICDFGMARLKIEGEAGSEGVLTEYVASRWYRPPQALLGITTCNDSIDLWSVGCVLAELVLKTPLFPGKSTIDQLELILKSIGMPSNSQIQRLASYQAQQVLRNFSFSKRCKVRSLQETLNACSTPQMDLIINLLKFNPNQRISSEQALKHEYFDEVKHMNTDLAKLGSYTSKILDSSLGVKVLQSQGRNSNCNPGIEEYRMLVDQLEKYAQRPTNRSGNAYNYQAMREQADRAIDIQNHSQKDYNQHEKFKQKSTKESDFVTMNKHHYLTSTLSLHGQQQGKASREAEGKASREAEGKTVVGPVKIRKIKKKKTFSRADILQKPLLAIDKSQKALFHKKQVNDKIAKMQIKQRKALTVGSKVQSHHRNTSAKQLKQRHQSASDKKPLLYTQPLPISKKKNSDDKGSKSLISNKSSSSLHRQSREKASAKCHFDQSAKLTIERVKKFMKPALNLNKTLIIKCKSPKCAPQFKKSS